MSLHPTDLNVPRRIGVSGLGWPAAVAVMLLMAVPAGGQTFTDDAAEYLDLEVATLGVDIRTGAPLALLHQDWEQVLPIWIGEYEAQAIARARQGVEAPRPQTHDLLASVVDALGGTLEEVRVYDLRENTYFGALRIRVEGEIREVDSRPSDALALAVRTGARIRVATELLGSIPEVEFISAEGERAIARIRGMTVAVPSDGDRERFELPAEPTGVVALHSDGQVGARGIRRGDLIVEVQGESVDSALGFLESVGHQSRTSTLRMRVIRDGQEMEVDVPPVRPPGRVS